MEAGELAGADQPRDDLLDVDVRRMVAEVDQAEGLRAERLGGHQARPPVRNHRRIEGRLVELVFEEHPPVGRQARGRSRSATRDTSRNAVQVRLAGEVGAVGDPHRQRLRPELLADLDAFEVVRDRLVARRLLAMGQRAELVGERLTGLVLEGVGVDGVEADAERLRPLGELAIVADLVPRESAASRSASRA